MIVLCDTPAEAALMRRTLDGLIHRYGDAAPPGLAAAEVLLRATQHSSAQLGTVVRASLAEAGNDGLVSYTTAADLLGIKSRNTIAAMVRRGQLVKVGRRITRSSIERITRG